jgi:hypothetical protein
MRDPERNNEAWLSMMYQNRKGLSTDSKNFAKTHLVENRTVIKFSSAGIVRKKKSEN